MRSIFSLLKTVEIESGLVTEVRNRGFRLAVSKKHHMALNLPRSRVRMFMQSLSESLVGGMNVTDKSLLS
jgi:hypothetical protein